MKRTALTILGAAGLVTAALSGQANAAPSWPNGTFGFAPHWAALRCDTTDITNAATTTHDVARARGSLTEVFSHPSNVPGDAEQLYLRRLT